MLGFNYKLRSEAERSWFVYLSVSHHAEPDTALVQTAERLCCCTETRTLQGEMGQYLNLSWKQHMTAAKSNGCLTCHSSSLHAFCYFAERKDSQQKISQHSSAAKSCVPAAEGAAASALQIHKSRHKGWLLEKGQFAGGGWVQGHDTFPVLVSLVLWRVCHLGKIFGLLDHLLFQKPQRTFIRQRANLVPW